MAKYHGQGGRVYLSTTGSGTAVASIGLTSWSLNQPTDRVEVTAFEDVNKTYVQGKRDISGEFSGNWDHADDSLFDGADSTDGVKLYLYPSKDTPTIYFYGPAWLDASIEVGVDAAVTISGSFQAAGAWGRKP
jgi:hypothetical protein